MLEVAGLAVRYGPFLAVDGVTIAVGPGEIVGIVGPNGAGKSSIVRAIGGLVRPVAGMVTFAGTDLVAAQPHERVGRGLSIVSEGRGLFPFMTVEENLRIGGDPLGERARCARNIERACAMFPILAQRRWQAAGTMSGGQQQMLAVAVGLMCDPKLLILDEPSLGLAPIIIGDIGRTLKALRQDGLTIAIFEQNAKLTCSVADRIYLLSNGIIRHHGPAGELMTQPDILEHLV